MKYNIFLLWNKEEYKSFDYIRQSKYILKFWKLQRYYTQKNENCTTRKSMKWQYRFQYGFILWTYFTFFFPLKKKNSLFFSLKRFYFVYKIRFDIVSKWPQFQIYFTGYAQLILKINKKQKTQTIHLS